MRSWRRLFKDRGWHRTRVENFKQCAEDAEQIAVTSERNDGFCKEVELTIQPPYSLDDDLGRMLQTDRAEIADLEVEESCTTIEIRIY